MKNKFRPKNGARVGFDCETTGLNPWGTFKHWGFYPARPYAFSFCDAKGNTFYVRWKVDPFTREVIPEKKSFNQLQDILENPRIFKVGHNVGYDVRMSVMSDIEFKSDIIHDTLIMAHVVTGGNRMTYALKPLSQTFLDISQTDELDLHRATVVARREAKKKGWCIAVKGTHGKDPTKADYWMAPHELCKKYAIQDAERTMLLYLLWKDDIKNNPDFKKVYTREMKLFHVVA